MSVRRAAAFGALALVILALPAAAGPCTQEIYDTDNALGKKLDAVAGAGRTATESPAATLHHQPTPKSIASAEERLGEMPLADAQAFGYAMEEARKADAAGDGAKCQKALDEARRVLER